MYYKENAGSAYVSIAWNNATGSGQQDLPWSQVRDGEGLGPLTDWEVARGPAQVTGAGWTWPVRKWVINRVRGTCPGHRCGMDMASSLVGH